MTAVMTGRVFIESSPYRRQFVEVAFDNLAEEKKAIDAGNKSSAITGLSPQSAEGLKKAGKVDFYFAKGTNYDAEQALKALSSALGMSIEMG